MFRFNGLQLCSDEFETPLRKRDLILSQGESSFVSQVCTRICCYGDHLLTRCFEQEIFTASEEAERVCNPGCCCCCWEKALSAWNKGSNKKLGARSRENLAVRHSSISHVVTYSHTSEEEAMEIWEQHPAKGVLISNCSLISPHPFYDPMNIYSNVRGLTQMSNTILKVYRKPEAINAR